MEPVLASTEQVVFERAARPASTIGDALLPRLRPRHHPSFVAEVIEELGMRGQTVGVASVGCSVLAYNYLDVDFVEAAHGRAPAMATGIKRLLPDRTVFTYQGDGDLASIGMGEIVHCAGRGENITVIFVNNAVYGMTGGQMAPTTLPGMVTTSSPHGRDVAVMRLPATHVRAAVATGWPAYIARRSVHDAGNIRKAKWAIKTAFQTQLAGLGFSMVEILSPCPTNWGMNQHRRRALGQGQDGRLLSTRRLHMSDEVKAFAKAF